jgi:hypothetical protein
MKSRACDDPWAKFHNANDDESFAQDAAGAGVVV